MKHGDGCGGHGGGHGGRGDGTGCHDARDVAAPDGTDHALATGVVAVAAAGDSLTDAIDEHFGRAAYLQVIDVATMTGRAIANPARDGHHAAGISAAELVAAERVQAVIAMKLGPKAVDAFRRARIPVYGAAPMSVAEAVGALTRGALPRLDLV